MSAKPIDLEVLCRRCLRTWVPTRKDMVAGSWKVCPKCRAAAEVKEAA